ncbi:unnamed protein product [Vicia faba]|uniref:LOB domain-containing protein n=1 Tax=Vicia faba TaxID=3906 RepID=A0AAV0YNR5_VICFA|nr:unnamed protein product [Vicia faba]
MIYGRCAACKSQRRKCPSDCIFFPYFPANDPQRFAYVHKIYGGSNVGKMLKQLPYYVREHAANSLYLEAKYESNLNLKFVMPQSNYMAQFQWPNQTPN